MILATSSNVTLVNQTDVEYSIRQIAGYNSEDDNGILEEACNAEFPKLYTDKLTALLMVADGTLDEWPYGPTYQCCKCDADIVIAYPPEYPRESCRLCAPKIEEDYIIGVGKVYTVEPCKQHTNMPCISAHDLKLSVSLGILFLGIFSVL